jgi:hypothetical protein
MWLENILECNCRAFHGFGDAKFAYGGSNSNLGWLKSIKTTVPGAS